jgi:perosamine synthetase
VRVPITRLALGEEEALAAAEVVRSGWLAMGPRVAELEASLRNSLGAGEVVAVSSGTTALHLALHALGIGAGDEVLVPSLSFVASANAILHAGATPVFVEVERRSFNLDPADLERALGPRSRAILVVHQLGLPAELDPILELAARSGLAVIEDAACALGARYRGRPIGGPGGGALCVFSFHPRKVITTGEGGALATEDGAFAERLRLLRAQGISIPARARHASGEPLEEEVPEVGYNYRMTDLQAAIGLPQLRRLPALLARRRALAARYDAALARLPGIVTPLEPDGCEHAYQSYMVLLEGPWPRREVMVRMLDQGIATRRAVTAIHELAAYQGRATRPLPVTEEIARRGLILPLFPDLAEAEQDEVVAALASALR